MRAISVRAERDALRVALVDAGRTHGEIAEEFMARYGYRPRAAFRYAHGWSLTQAAGHINAHAADLNLDPLGRAAMTSPHLSEVENWPYPSARRRPTPHALVLLASVYGTDVHSLVDVHDRARMRPADRLVIDAIACAHQPARCPHCRREPTAVVPRVPRARPDALAWSGSLTVPA
ncbi:hypothetical protein ThrDRAFT_04277 [Frankia casuarinae]|uniref:Uncharacterized protein n=1 Tax=Frankia casuarinae (strain DSM 45818 / CECT 9043 / HFP020203 / CcI3) TaxID=106370 RepID=Q2J9I2_FRACC|nr:MULTISPECIES: hypothetical protein [Frankia]ABD12060.1 hypothetical protein Francci3_2699 [Frankia casuarinae]ETA01995.1 hypothetical protein CcI6DRAFT_02518 [Frankia sp. CcI6]EYT90107.1 hypothetical protein ThrDRAFT_04277 [Frankia casuarinae]OAA23207.1 hypothetical protein AAY23_105635 [Frankia casuarinae]OHV53702.1 hypothetical protein CgIS1_13845 [Frankia sp. CgIS1]